MQSNIVDAGVAAFGHVIDQANTDGRAHMIFQFQPLTLERLTVGPGEATDDQPDVSLTTSTQALGS